MSLQQIEACLEQKNIFITNIINITNQIIVLSSQPIVNLENLLNERQNNMDRIDKCNALIESSSEDLEGEENQIILELFQKKQPSVLTEKSATLFKLVEKYEELLVIAIETDKSAKKIFNQSFSEIRKKLIEIRSKKSINPEELFTK